MVAPEMGPLFLRQPYPPRRQLSRRYPALTCSLAIREAFPCLRVDHARRCTIIAMVPQSLTHTSARVLEFDSFRDLLRAYAPSPLGQARIAELAPSADSTWLERQHLLTSEIREFLRVGSRFEFSGLLDPTALVNKSRIAGVALEAADIRDVVAVVDRAAEWREVALHPPAMKTEWVAVPELSAGIIDFTQFLRAFRNKILPDGTLDDRASPQLGSIRREIEKQKRLIQESLRSHLRRLSEGGSVQDELVTIRGERFVIPVKVEQKRRVNGVVHGVSSSGQTVFIEPLETIDQNNELVRLLEEEQAEIHRILLEMTRRVGAVAKAILLACDILGELELQFAKARLANDYECVAVTFGDQAMVLRNARHPLLERNFKSKGGRVVPISVELRGEWRRDAGATQGGELRSPGQPGAAVPTQR